MKDLMHGPIKEQSIIALICLKCHILTLIQSGVSMLLIFFPATNLSHQPTFGYSFVFSKLQNPVVNFPVQPLMNQETCVWALISLSLTCGVALNTKLAFCFPVITEVCFHI